MHARFVTLFLLACTRPDPGHPDDPDDPEGFEWALGDPIEWIGSEGERGRGQTMEDLEEWVDAAVLTADIGLVVGQGGAKTIDMTTGGELQLLSQDVGYHVEAQDGLAVIATKHAGVLLLMDTSSPSQVSLTQTLDLGMIHQDIALDESRILVALQSEGALLMDTQGTLISTLPTHAYGVGLDGDRAVSTDGPELVLYDISQTPAVELDRIELEGSGLDVEFDGSTIAVSLGGHGTQVLSADDDSLQTRAVLDTPGAVYSTELAGDHLWIASGEVVALAWVGSGEPQILGHETPAWSAMGIGAGFGRALVADWWSTTVLESVSGVAGPEVHTSEALYLTEVSQGRELLQVSNGGAMTLEFEIEPQAGGFEVDPMQFSLEPGASKNVSVRAFNPGEYSGSLRWNSNDPDEPTGEVRVEAARESLGSEHADFTLASFSWPESSPELITLSDARGSVVLLSYFATFCPLCHVEVPDLEASIAAPFEGEDLQIWLVNSGSTQDEAWNFAESYDIQLPMLMDTDMSIYMSYSRAEADLEEYAPFPVHVLIDRDGIIRYLEFRTDAEEIRRTIDLLLSE
jgi:peroxiredoxin